MRKWLVLSFFLVLTPITLSNFPSTSIYAGSAQAIPEQDSPQRDWQQGCPPIGPVVIKPAVDPARYCLEYLLEELPYTATAVITSITFAPDCRSTADPRDWCGRLFFVRPDIGAVMWVGDFDAVSQQYSIHTFATGLDFPNGLAFYNDILYVAGDQVIYRLFDRNNDNLADEVEQIVDDLPGRAGLWTGSIRIGPDERLYVSKGASCDDCVESDTRRAAILSYALDGSDEQIVATGLHNAFDFGWQPSSNILWIAESSGSPFEVPPPLDELNRLTTTGENFGWPYCYTSDAGIYTNPLLETPLTQYCEQTTTPLMTFPAHSAPSGVAFYYGTAFPHFTDDLLLVLRGTYESRVPTGHAVYRVCLDSAGSLEPCTDRSGNQLVDAQGQPVYRELLVPLDGFHKHGLEVMNIEEQGFYPEHPVDVAVAPDGTIIISVMEGRIIRMLPAN